MATWYWQGGEYDVWDATLFTDDYAGNGSNPATIPWTTSATKDDDIELGELGNPYTTLSSSIGNGFAITGICTLNYIDFINGYIYGGTFTGDYINVNSAGGEIYGGLFTGTDLNNGGLIYGGTFSGSAFANNGDIYDGVFTGLGFSNNDDIYGGVFTGSSFYNNGYIYSGVFTGTSFTSNGYIFSGVFTGSGFTNNSYISSGFWWLKGSSKINGVNLRASGDANPSTKFMILETSDILGSGLL